MPGLDAIREDIATVLERDPAAQSALQVFLCYPGLHAVWAHRLSNRLWRDGHQLAAHWLSKLVRFLTGIEIHPGATIGRRFFIDHGMGVVIGETAEIGEDVTLYHDVTLGGTSLAKGKRHPTLGDRVVVGAGARLLGAITVGADCRIGANSVVVKSVPPNSVVIGVPGQTVVRSKRHEGPERPDFEHAMMPDTLGLTVIALTERIEELEKALHLAQKPAPHPDKDGAWRGEDFSI